MIFACFGNSPLPFYRMAEALDHLASLIDEEVIVQRGLTDYDFRNCKSFDFTDNETFHRYLSECDIAILQGGWGTISEASDLGKRCIAIPRRVPMEHYHDQAHLVRALEDENILLGCYDTNDLPAIVEKARIFNFQKIKRGNSSDIINAFLSSIK